jgi:hypothetical protein
VTALAVRHPTANALRNIALGLEPDAARELMEAAALIEQLANPDWAAVMAEVRATVEKADRVLPAGFVKFQLLPRDEYNARGHVINAGHGYLAVLSSASDVSRYKERYEGACAQLAAAEKRRHPLMVSTEEGVLSISASASGQAEG